MKRVYYLTLLSILPSYVIPQVINPSREVTNPTCRKSDRKDSFCDTSTYFKAEEEIKVVNLTLPFLKSFSVSIGNPKEFNVTFLDGSLW